MRLLKRAIAALCLAFAVAVPFATPADVGPIEAVKIVNEACIYG
jgi:hypothetical protein